MPAVPLRNTHDRFGLVAQALHWAMAGLIVVLVPLGVYMHELPLSPRKLELYGLHKSLGMTLLGLAVLRILWRLMDPPPPPVAGAPAWQNRAAGAVHLALYGLMVAMPLSGWIMSSAANFPVSVFGLFTAPNLVGPDKGLEDLAKGVHFALGLAL
ncbi:MAG: cytochrome b, partial [Rhodobacterales bacterium]|nr:cytochrome b [Rhodobacterales bacterium]